MTFSQLCRSNGSWYLLFFLPGILLLAYYVHVQTVDLFWMYKSSHLAFFGEAQATQVAAAQVSLGLGWSLGKQALWPLILFVLEMLTLAVIAAVLALVVGVPNQAATIAKAALWSKATVLITAIAVLVSRGLTPRPARVLTKDIDPLSWNSLLQVPGDGPLQFYTSFHGPVAILGAMILILAFKQITGMGWVKATCLGSLPYFVTNAAQYYVFGVVFKL
jgi:hypothetical protein